MELSLFFRSVLEQDLCPVVPCSLNHEIIYMNPAAAERYAHSGGASLIGQSLLSCHNGASRDKIEKVVAWFAASPQHNRVFTFHNETENKDVYMIALRGQDGTLAGYYEKHEYRTPEAAALYQMDD